MGKKKQAPSSSAKKTARSSASSADLRRKLADLDERLIRDMQRRAELAKQIAAAEPAGEQPPANGDPDGRLRKLLVKSTGPLDETCLRAVFRELASGVRALVQPVRVAYLGPEYSYSHLASIERFGQSCELVPVATISAVFQEVNNSHVEAGLVPIENSTDGRIVDTLEMFTRLPVRICGEVQMRIHHNLLGQGPRAEITEVCSKPQALSQCRQWLATHLPQARTEPMTSTTAAAQKAANDPRVAAIASRQAGINYGLNLLAQNIEDHQDNVTRFAVIGREPGKRTGNDKTSLMFELPHQPGALADSMAIFRRNRLNLTWIESFPKPGSKNEYLFFVELEGHQQELRVRRAIAALQNKTVRTETLGSYAKTEPVG